MHLKIVSKILNVKKHTALVFYALFIKHCVPCHCNLETKFMKFFWVVMIYLILVGVNTSNSKTTNFTETAVSCPAQQIDPCKLKGAVFVERYRNYADYSVYVEETEAFGKLKVFKEEAAIFATEPGWWYFTDQRGFADFTIYIEETKGFQNFTISFTEFRSSAGCN